jgi:uncharacterized protein YjcR
VTKKHGGQPGNKNAFKHGFYSQHYTTDEIKLLDELDDDILHEIKLLRVITNRIMEMVRSKITYSEDDRALLNLLNNISANIGSLTTRRAFQTGRVTAVQEAITEAILSTAPMNFPHLTGSKK